jgi:protoheme IX farnesyltransferase
LNIVIGGAAGAFPPLVGWAAATGSLPPVAWSLFILIFLWTPVHFWSLALLLADDYAKAGVPMLPVVRGPNETVRQIFIYSLTTLVAALIPFWLGEAGLLYLATALTLSAYLVWLSWKLHQDITQSKARSLFHYSMIYLALIFLFLAIDRSFI